MDTNLLSRYNSPILSDVTILLPPVREVKKRKTTDGEPEDERKKIFAHKVILASGSSVFEEHFQENTSTPLEFELDSVFESEAPECYEPMLRYIYGLSLDDEIKDMEIETVMGLYNAAEQLGIPELRKYVLRKLEERLVNILDNLLYAPEDGPPHHANRGLLSFVADLDVILSEEESSGRYR